MNDYKAPEETLLDKFIIGTLFIVLVVTMALAPDVFVDKQVNQTQQKDHHGN
jgi:hypothetical protein